MAPLRRLFSTTPALSTTLPTAAQTATAFLATHGTTTHTATQPLSPHQAALLHHTLSRPVPPSPLLPAGYHLAYFPPHLPTSALGPDGTDTTFNPPAPFTRRMWAGGALSWSRSNPLALGDPATEATRVLGASATRTRAGSPMVVVRVAKTLSNPRGPALLDQRNWLFQQPLPPGASAAQHPLDVVSEAPTRKPASFAADAHGFAFYRDHYASPAQLLRFSALTFNAHRIHYDGAYAATEGHPRCVVHGPLNLVLMLDLWRDARGSGQARGEVVGRCAEARLPRRFEYRNTRPVYVGTWFRVGMREAEGGWEVEVRDEGGERCVVGRIEEFEEGEEGGLEGVVG